MNTSVIEAQYPITFRENESKELGEHLKHRHCVNLIGMKRVGISNFLRFFLYHKDIPKTYIADNHKHLFVPIDLNDLVEREIYPFWTLTLKRIVDATEKSTMPQEVKNKINNLFLTTIQSQDLFLLMDNVREALVLVVDHGFLPSLFFLRFDRIADALTPSFFDNLEGLRDATHEELVYVFTSYRSLDSLFPSAKTSLSVLAQLMYVKPALEKDMKIIYEAYRERYKFNLSKELEQSLFSLVSGNVQYLQLALIILNEKKNETINSKEELFELLVNDERLNLQSEELWESLIKEEKKLLIKIIREEKLSDEEKNQTSYLLQTGFLIEREGKVSLLNPLFEFYLTSNGKDEKHENSTTVHLTRKEHLIFNLLKSHLGGICEREEIVEVVWPEYKDLGVSDWAIDRLVARVRVKLKQQNSPYEIVTVRTRGYKLSVIGA
jgi:hypothetical protein